MCIVKSKGIQKVLFNDDSILYYKPSSTIQIERNFLTNLQLRQFTAIMYVVENKLTFDPFSLNKAYINNNPQIFKYIDHAIPISVLKKYTSYTSRNHQCFISSIDGLSTQSIRFNIFGKDKDVKVGFHAPLFKLSGLDSKSEDFEDILPDKNDGFFFFSLNDIVKDLAEDIMKARCHVPINIVFRRKYTIGLYELLLDYCGNGINYLGKRKVNEIAAILGGENYLYNLPLDKFKQLKEKEKKELPLHISNWKKKCLSPAIEELKQRGLLNEPVIEFEKIVDSVYLKMDVELTNENEKSNSEINIPLLYKIIKQYKKSSVKKTLSNIFIKNELGCFLSIEKAMLNPIDFQSLYERILADNSLVCDLFYTSSEKNELTKDTLKNIKIMLLNTIYKINPNYEKWKFLIENKEYEIIHSAEDKTSGKISVNSFIIAENAFQKNHKVQLVYFGTRKDIYEIFEIDIANNSFNFSKTDSFVNEEDLIKIIFRGFKVFNKEGEEFLINASNLIKHTELIKENLINNNRRYFKCERQEDTNTLQTILFQDSFDLEKFINIYKGESNE